jgi:hypothetical protein
MTFELSRRHCEASRSVPSHRRSTRRMILSAALAAAMISANGPDLRAAHFGQTTGKDAEPAAAGPSAGNHYAVDAQLQAAAEPFATLTETAFSVPKAELRKTLAKAEEALQRVRPLLSKDAADEAADHASVLKAAAAKTERALMALASIEVYRDLVSSVSGAAKVLRSVSLMDYAGFRYDADLKADPIRWSDMGKAAQIAKQEWLTLAPRVGSLNLAAEVSAAVAGMVDAAERKDMSAAARSAKAELDLVDQLETHFASRRAAGK